MISKSYYIYILTNKYNKVLYIGVTNDLIRRVYEHKKHFIEGFTQKYHVDKLVYYEMFDDPLTAIKREKTLKNLLRRKKEELINKMNPMWKDLYEEILS
ncbi:MAG: hypothetical protein UT58_C0041G0005 [Microgenomates group bacterium GW2011_GWC1_39_7b]|uniref:GIY-YIG domain-containing protein n=2 Tax=Candidatus Woeseibacteriota TaxID=1752722 RepID=A0A0G0X763_9BACT|nr:MAG: hypothetical protein UT17_C0002G0149 [Candidatus Woesebacteria bacterium GW2011_GWB1_39_10]KKR25608.1 MAG: hypothetical protein UT58_C0041G0005 [Microgenomates group bacterium GW2011_GWC1_39_7b]KKR92500.1 MAG: hypothetical protein UU42_C0001G0104 [Candidatus Woesebacteria bacterium GW2011_GWA1_41_13b]